jgi:hypothetical protein
MESSRACWTGEGEIEFYLLLDPLAKSSGIFKHRRPENKLSCAFCICMAAKPLNNEMNMNHIVAEAFDLRAKSARAVLP